MGFCTCGRAHSAIGGRGFEELVDGWIHLTDDVLEDTDTKKSELFDPFEHKLVKEVLPDYFQGIEGLYAGRVRVKVSEEKTTC